MIRINYSFENDGYEDDSVFGSGKILEFVHSLKKEDHDSLQRLECLLPQQFINLAIENERISHAGTRMHFLECSDCSNRYIEVQKTLKEAKLYGLQEAADHYFFGLS